MSERCIDDRVPRALRDGDRLGAVCIEDPRKLFSADPSDELAVTRDVVQAVAQFTQDAVADQVPVLVVDGLEMIDVNDRDAQRLPMAGWRARPRRAAARETLGDSPSR